MTTEYYPTKRAAIRAIIDAGFTVHDETSSSGDYALGSREYYKRPDAEVNQYGVALNRACASKVPRCWAVNY